LLYQRSAEDEKTLFVLGEFFDFIIVDECHHSIYELWSQVLLYFDSFLIGLTATPAGKTIGICKQNLIMYTAIPKPLLTM
jgi:type I restriction enzyme R subunit